ncbi:MAG: Membrane protein [Caulobacter sp.]|nr:Membrane protein [Caulobacter sp.]
MGHAIVTVIDAIFSILTILLIVTAVASWLVAFNVINPSNPNVRMVLQMLDRLTDPLLRPIRRFVPSLGGVDISFIVLWLALIFLRQIFAYELAPLLIANLG